MQKAIRNYIEEESKKNISFEDTEKVINRISDYEIKRARQKQLRRWRKNRLR